jgi:hypothetical protein
MPTIPTDHQYAIRGWLLVSLLLAALMAGTGGATAAPCEGPVLMQSGFSRLPQQWQPPNNLYRPRNGNYYGLHGKLIVQPDSGRIFHNYLDLGGEHDLDVCTTVVVGADPGAVAGLAIHGEGTEILFALNGAGVAMLKKFDRVAKGWSDLVPMRHDAAIKSVKEPNRLAIQIAGNDATFLINGMKFASVTGQIPKGTLHMSLATESLGQQASTLQFDDILITAAGPAKGKTATMPDALIESAPPCSGQPIAANDFKAPLPPENVFGRGLEVKSGKLNMKLAAGDNSSAKWDFAPTSDLDVCVTTGLVDGAGASVSLQLVGKSGIVTFYLDQLRGTGTITFYDSVKRVSTTLVPRQWMTAIWRYRGAVNRLHVRVHGGRAAFYVNGSKFGAINAQPAGPLTAVFLSGTAERNRGATWAFDDLIVTPAKAIELAATKPKVVASTTARPPVQPSSSASTEPAPVEPLPVGKNQPASGAKAPEPTAPQLMAPKPVAPKPPSAAPVIAKNEPVPAAKSRPTTRKVLEVGPPSCLTRKAQINTFARGKYGANDPAVASMLNDLKAQGPIHWNVDRQIDGWDFCPTEATPAPQYVALDTAKTRISLTTTCHMYYDKGKQTVFCDKEITDFGAIGYLRIFTSDHIQTSYDVLVRPDLGAAAFHVYLDVAFRYPYSFIGTGRPYKALSVFDFPIKIQVDGKVVADGPPAKLATPDRRESTWRYDLVKFGLRPDTLPLIRKIEASFKIPEKFRVDAAQAQEIVFYRATLANTPQLLAAMNAYSAAELKKPAQITDAMRKAQILKDARRRCPTCPPPVVEFLAPEQIKQRQLDAKIKELRTIDAWTVPRNKAECAALANKVSNLYEINRPPPTHSSSRSSGFFAGPPSKGDRTDYSIIGEAFEMNDVAEIAGKCRAGRFDAALRMAHTLMHNLYDPIIAGMKEAPMLRAIDAMAWPKSREECLSLAQRVAKFAAQAPGGRDKTNMQVVTKLETDLCLKRSFTVAATEAQDELRRLVKTRHIAGPLK